MTPFSCTLPFDILEGWAAKPDMENIIIGTGAMAKDVRRALHLLGLKAPFLIGDKSDPANDIRHYSEIASLGNPKQYRFILCCDIHEWALLSPAKMAAYRFLGRAARNHPQLVRFQTDNIRIQQIDYAYDAGNENVFLSNRKPYVVFGDECDEHAFSIHILGTCNSGSIFKYDQESYPELLQRSLAQRGFRSVVYAWGQPNSPMSNSLLMFVRDVCFHEVDLLMMYPFHHDPLRFATRSILATRAGSVGFAEQRLQVDLKFYKKRVSNGIDHDILSLRVPEIQHRIFTALSKMHGFVYWDVMIPTATTLTEEQSMQFSGLNATYLERQRKARDELRAMLNKEHTKDYTDIFSEVDDIYAMFADADHFSSEGSRWIAERCAKDIVETFEGR